MLEVRIFLKLFYSWFQLKDCLKLELLNSIEAVKDYRDFEVGLNTSSVRIWEAGSDIWLLE